MAQVLTANTMRKMATMCRVKDGRQRTHKRRCKSITQQVSDEQRDGYSRGAQGRWHDILRSSGAGPLVKQNQQRSEYKEDTENPEVVDGHSQRKRWGTQQEANATYQHTCALMTTVKYIGQVAAKNSTCYTGEYNHGTGEETGLS